MQALAGDCFCLQQRQAPGRLEDAAAAWPRTCAARLARASSRCVMTGNELSAGGCAQTLLAYGAVGMRGAKGTHSSSGDRGLAVTCWL